MARGDVVRALLPLALLALAACGPGTPSETGEFTLIVAKTAVALAAGGTTTVNITVSPTNGFKKDVGFSAAEPTGTIQATFDPASSATGTVLKLEVPAGAAAKAYTVLVKGSSTVNGTPVERTDTITLTVTPPPGINVGGTVRNGFGNPIAGASVSIGAKNTTSDATGGFSIAGVNTPYTVIVLPAGASTRHEFVGLTRADPNLTLFNTSNGQPPGGSSTVSGTLSGVTFPNPANHIASVAFASGGGGAGFGNLLAAQGPAYSFSANWPNSSTQSGTLFAMQGQPVTGVPGLAAFDSYTGFAKKGVTLSNGIASSGQNLALTAPVTTQAITANVTLPAGGALTSKRLFLTLGPKSILLLSLDTGAGLSSTYKTPSVGQTLGVTVNATVGSRSVEWQQAGLQPNEIVTANLPAPVALTAPPGSPNGVAKSVTLAWSGVSDSVYLLGLGAEAVVYAAQPSYLATLSGNTSYTWVVTSTGPFASMDEFTGTRLTNGYPQAGFDVTYSNTTSEAGTFKTVP